MKTFGLLMLLAAAASALPADIPAAVGDNIVFRCVVNKEFNVVVKERKTPFHLCSSPDGDHFLMVIDGLENNFETSLQRVEVVKLRELNAITVGAPAGARPKRTPQLGFGGGGSGSQASANSYSGGAGGGFGSPLGGGGYGGGGGYSNAAASSNSYGGGGGFGGGPFYYG